MSPTGEIWYDGAWHEIPLYLEDGVTITRGRADKLQRAMPAKCTCAVDNTSGDYAPRNPDSPLFGKIGKNTPFRIREDSDVRFVGEIESWPMRFNVDESKIWAPITANGILQRLGGKGTKAPVRSSMRRALTNSITASLSPPLTYWAMNAGKLATAATVTAGTGEALAAASGTAEWGSGELAPWLEPGLAMASPVTVRGRVTGMSAAPERITVDVLRKGKAGGAGPSVITISSRPDGSTVTPYRLFSVTFTPVFNEVDVVMVGASTGSTGPVSADSAFTDGLTHVRVELEQGSPTEIGVTVYINQIPVLSDIYTGELIGAQEISLSYNPGDSTEPLVWGHLAVWDGDPLTLADLEVAARGHPGEAADVRLARLALEEGVTFPVFTGAATSPMGPQRLQPVVESMWESVEVDMGHLVESRDVLGLTYITHGALYSQDTAFTLDFAAEEITPPLAPDDDTAEVVNDVTVTAVDGNEHRRERTTGPNNVSEPVDDPQGVGRIEGQYPINVNTDLQLAAHSGWRLHLGTWDEPRWPSVVVDLEALNAAGKTALAAAVAALDVGGRFALDNLPAYTGGATSGLIALGFKEEWTGEDLRHLIEINATAAGPWDVCKLGDPTYATFPTKLARGDEGP